VLSAPEASRTFSSISELNRRMSRSIPAATKARLNSTASSPISSISTASHPLRSTRRRTASNRVVPSGTYISSQTVPPIPRR
jgi:hypothetical protein